MLQETDSNLQFDEMILEAARGIMAASSALVRAANAAQRELIDQGKVARTPHISSDDGQWSEGLISAARLVAAATHSLVEAAQNLVQGLGTEEVLISTAKQVAASTAQLLIACKVRSDPNSETGRRLQAAGNAVIKSTDNLVRAAQQALDMEEEHILKINTSMVDGMAQEINARSEVIKMEKQLEEARNKLCAIRQAKYRHRTNVGYDESDDQDYLPPPPPPPLPSNYSGYHSAQVGGPSTQSPYSGSHRFNDGPSTYGSSNLQQAPTNTGSLLGRTVLTANSTPRPYQSESIQSISQVSPLLTRSYTTSAQPPSEQQSTFLSRPKNQQTPGSNAQLEACVQDLHEKTFGKSGVVPLSSFKTVSNSEQTKSEQKYDGYTTR